MEASFWVPPPLAVAGRLANDRAFSGETIACEGCNSQKTPLEHHCMKCDCCAVWMDHHCQFCGVCIGFRNMRCFIVWLSYGTALLRVLGLLTLHRLYQLGLPRSLWWGLWCPWFQYLYWTNFQLTVTLQFLLMQVAAGFHSQVMMRKFVALLDDGLVLEEKMRSCMARLPPPGPGGAECEEFVALRDSADEIRLAANALRSGVKGVAFAKQDLVWGPFLGEKPSENLPIIFGAKPSWRWCLPLVPGGTGDPHRPSCHSARGCKAWGRLAAGMERGQLLLAQSEVLAWDNQQRLMTLLKGAEATFSIA